MPKEVSICALNWQDIYIHAHNIFGRTPTKQEVLALFEVTQEIMEYEMDDAFCKHIIDALQQIITDYPTLNQYSIHEIDEAILEETNDLKNNSLNNCFSTLTFKIIKVFSF